MNARGSLRIFLLAGEASGDAYGAALACALTEACEAHGTDLRMEGWGGDAMEEAGVRIHKHIRDTGRHDQPRRTQPDHEHCRDPVFNDDRFNSSNHTTL